MDEHRGELDIERLVADHYRGVFGYAYRLTGSVADAEDFTQRVFLTAQRKLGDLHKAECARSWLFTILRNCFWKASQKRRPVLAGSLAMNLNTIPEHVPRELEIDRERLQQVLNELPERYRLVLAMFYYEDRSYREIAELLDLPIGTVMSRLARAKSQLRSKLFGLNDPIADAYQEKTAGQRG